MTNVHASVRPQGNEYIFHRRNKRAQSSCKSLYPEDHDMAREQANVLDSLIQRLKKINIFM